MMDKLMGIIIVVGFVSLSLFLVQIGVQQKIDVWPISKVTEVFTNIKTDEGISVTNPGTSGGGNEEEKISGSDNPGGQIPDKPFDSNGDGFLSCDLTAGEDYTLSGNHIEIRRGGDTISFNFQQVTIDERLHPDNLPEVNLKFNLYPDNPDSVIYTNIFLADDNGLYVCY